MLIFLNFGPNGVNWYVAPLAMILLLHGDLLIRLLVFIYSRFSAGVNSLFEGYLDFELDKQEARQEAKEVDEPEGVSFEVQARIVVTILLACFLFLIILTGTAYTTFLLFKRAYQVGWRQLSRELVDLFCLGIQGRAVPPRMNAHVNNARMNVERAVKRMKELPIELYKSVDDLKALPARDLRDMLKWKRINSSHIFEKHELLKALIESDSTSNRTCSICREDYLSGEVLRVLPCKHKYHSECIEKWFTTASQYTRSPACPYCNAPLFSDN